MSNTNRQGARYIGPGRPNTTPQETSPSLPPLMAEFKDKAERIRESYGRSKRMITSDETINEEYRTKKLNEAYLSANEEMAELRRAYPQARKQEIEKSANAAFVCSRDAKTEYLQAVTSADSMSSEERQKFFRNAKAIEAHDTIRAIGRAAFNANDTKTLTLMMNEGTSRMQDDLRELKSVQRGIGENGEREFQMFEFVLRK